MGKVIKEKQNGDEDYALKTVVIDPGHGGHDTGCTGIRSREKHIALSISQRLAQAIQNAYPDIRVILTRSTDKFIPLHRRANIANKNKADLFISVHCNAMRSANHIKGSETYVLGLHRAEENLAVAKRENSVVLLEENYQDNYDFDPHSDEGHIMLSMVQNAFLDQSILFASKVEKKMEYRANRHSRGVKQAGFVVLRQTTMPSVLVEAGFLTNGREEEFLRTAVGQQIIANAVFEAFRDYKQEVETGVPAQSDLAYEKPRKEPVTIHKAPSKASGPLVKEQPVKKVLSSRSASLIEPFPLSDAQHSRKKEDSKIQFRVQLAASPTPINITKGKWQRTDYLIEIIMEEKMYKYQIPRFYSFDEANRVKQILRHRGFQDAFVVAYKNGSRMNIHQAKRQTTGK